MHLLHLFFFSFYLTHCILKRFAGGKNQSVFSAFLSRSTLKEYIQSKPLIFPLSSPPRPRSLLLLLQIYSSAFFPSTLWCANYFFLFSLFSPTSIHSLTYLRVRNEIGEEEWFFSSCLWKGKKDEERVGHFFLSYFTIFTSLADRWIQSLTV